VETTRNRRKTVSGTVVSDKMEKTITVRVSRRVKHPLYHKFITKSKKYHAHDEANECRVGDEVRLMETRPLSRSKRWRVVEILKRAE